jgi:hypothetical protein
MSKKTSPKARERSRGVVPTVDDTKAVFRWVKPDGTAITLGRPFATMVIAILLMLLLGPTGVMATFKSGAALFASGKAVLSLIRRFFVPD